MKLYVGTALAFGVVASGTWIAGSLVAPSAFAESRAPAPALNQTAPSAVNDAGVHWFTGSVEEAFESARKEGKPVLLYVGTVWCPGCNQLKGRVFPRQDFIEKSRHFVMVHLDGDDPVAQKWTQTFAIQGFPTLLVISPQRAELARISGDVAVSGYKEFMDLGISAGRPVDALLADLRQPGRTLSVQDCHRLAYTTLPDRAAGSPVRLSSDLDAAATHCPSSARAEKARLTVLAAREGLFEEDSVLSAGGAPSKHLSNLLRKYLSVIADPELIHAARDALDPNSLYFVAVERAKLADPVEFRDHWIAILTDWSRDPSLDGDGRMNAINRKLNLLLERDGTISPTEAQQAVPFVESMLASTTAPEARMTVVGNAANIFEMLRMWDRERSLLESEIRTSAAPTRYILIDASFEERQGNEAKALRLYERAYLEEKDPASKIPDGVGYIDKLVHAHPSESGRIRDVSLSIIDGLDGPDRITRRIAHQLTRLDALLRAWNGSGKHADTVSVIHQHLEGICKKLAATDIGHPYCAGLLAGVPRQDLSGPQAPVRQAVAN